MFIHYFVIFLLMLSLSTEAQTLRDSDRKKIEDIIEQYIWNNPEVIWDSLQRYRTYLEEQKQKKFLVQHYYELYEDRDTPIFNEGGTKIIVEFFDYACGFCKVMLRRLLELFKEDRSIRLILKELPILGDDSVLASRGALAVWLQDREAYWVYHGLLMDYEGTFTQEVLESFVRDLGIDMDRWRRDQGSSRVEAMIEKNYRLAQALDLTGTPSFVIGDELIQGSMTIQALQALLQQE